jgi:hypothetical protein
MPADWSGGLSTGLQGVAVKGYLHGWVTGVDILHVSNVLAFSFLRRTMLRVRILAV